MEIRADGSFGLCTACALRGVREALLSEELLCLVDVSTGLGQDMLFEAIKAGAAAFLLKDIGPEDLVTIIRRVNAGEYFNAVVAAEKKRRWWGRRPSVCP